MLVVALLEVVAFIERVPLLNGRLPLPLVPSGGDCSCSSRLASIRQEEPSDNDDVAWDKQSDSQ